MMVSNCKRVENSKDKNDNKPCGIYKEDYFCGSPQIADTKSDADL